MSQQASNAGALVGKWLGKYEILALLALGGTAEIYLARVGGVAGFEKYVVVKCLHDHLADDSEFVHMFLDEARLGAQLDHSNIVQTLELGEQDGRYYMVMEYLAGMSLSMIVRKIGERVPGGRVPVDLILSLLAQACAGLHYAHRRMNAEGKPLRIVHRDISPQNLVVSFEGVLKIVDFGIAKASERDTRTQNGTIKGKFAYMSPEQCKGEHIDHRSDIFALGIVLHELLTGQRLFKRNSAFDTYHAILECNVPLPSQVNHELDPAIDPIVMNALQFDPEKRYANAETFGDAMLSMLHKRGKSAGPGAVARFFSLHFQAEIDEHAQRMRALIAGRQTPVQQWDEDEGESENRGDFGQEETLPPPTLLGFGVNRSRPGEEQNYKDEREGDQAEEEDDEESEDGSTDIELDPSSKIAMLHEILSGQKVTVEQVLRQTSGGQASREMADDEDGATAIHSPKGGRSTGRLDLPSPADVVGRRPQSQQLTVNAGNTPSPLEASQRNHSPLVPDSHTSSAEADFFSSEERTRVAQPTPRNQQEGGNYSAVAATAHTLMAQSTPQEQAQPNAPHAPYMANDSQQSPAQPYGGPHYDRLNLPYAMPSTAHQIQTDAYNALVNNHDGGPRTMPVWLLVLIFAGAIGIGLGITMLIAGLA